MKIKALIILFFLVFYNGAPAQKATPTTEIAVPSDTSKTAPPEIKPEPKSPKIELPDVLILGKDQYHRTVKDKKEVTPESPTLIRRQTAYEPLSSWFGSEEKKPHLQSSDSLPVRQLWGKLRGGSFFTFDGDAGYWQKLAKGDALAYLWFNRSEGQYANTKLAEGGLSGKISYEAAPKVMSIARVEYDRCSRGLYSSGYNVDNAVRTAGAGLFAVDLQYDVNKLSDGNLGFELGGVGVTDRAGGEQLNRTDNFYYDIHFDYTSQIKTMQLTGRGSYLRETLESTIDSASTYSSFAVVGVEALQPISNIFSAAIGADYHIFHHDTLYTRSRLSPFARINIMPNDYIGLSLHLATGLTYDSFLQHWENNYYLTYKMPLRPSEENFGFKLKGDMRITDKIKFQGAYAQHWMKEMFYWQADASNGLIALNRTSDVKLGEIQIGVIAEISARTRLQVSYIEYSDKLSAEPPPGMINLNRLPYRADFRMPIRASIRLLPDLNLTLTADIVGERRKDINSDAALPAYGLFHADLGKEFGRNISALLSVKNLLDARYSIWEGYPETGIVILGGVRARF